MHEIMRNLEQTFTVSEVSLADKELLKKIFMLRVKCREESGFITFEKFPEGWYDEEDATAKHFAVFDDDLLVASARVNIYDSIAEIPALPAFPKTDLAPGKIGFLYRNGVLPAYRNMGISKLMNAARERYLRGIDCRYSMGYCHDFQVVNFAKHGYKNAGVLDTSRIKWDLNPDNWFLMIRELV